MRGGLLASSSPLVVYLADRMVKVARGTRRARRLGRKARRPRNLSLGLSDATIILRTCALAAHLTLRRSRRESS